MSVPKPLIVLLGPATRYAPKMIKSLEEAGYCTIILDSLDQVRVIQPLEVPERELFARAALKAISMSDNNSQVRQMWGRAMLDGALATITKTEKPEAPK